MSYNEDFQSKVIDSLARLETHMEDLVGNGKPGRVANLEEDVEDLKKTRWTLGGAVIGIAGAISAIVHFVFKY
jgi:hypothetical protein